MIGRLLILAGVLLTGAGMYETLKTKKKVTACPSGAEGAASEELPAFKPDAGDVA
jgi:hypothetical protein